MSAYIFLVALLPVVLPAPLQLQNITITVPQGTSSHSDPHLICTPTKPQDILVFFLGNYFAHAATVKILPGEPLLSSLATIVIALLFPVSGLLRGMTAIYQAAILQKTPLETALRAGALFQVVRTRFWRPKHGDVVRDVRIVREVQETSILQSSRSSDIAERISDSHNATHANNTMEDMIVNIDITVPRASVLIGFQSDIFDDEPISYEEFGPSTRMFTFQGRNVHGKCELPVGYAIAVVDMDAEVFDLARSYEALNPDSPSSKTDENATKGKDGMEIKQETEVVLDVAEKASEEQYSATAQSRGNASKEPYEPGKRAISSSDLSSNHSFSKAVIAVIQLVFASLTIYQARGDQIEQYGYAAFGLTVSPYLIMSLVNLVGAFLTPDYSHVYLVSSDIMEEAQGRGGFFNGVVGTLSPTLAAEDSLVEAQDRETNTHLNVKFQITAGGITMEPLTEIDKLLATNFLGQSSCEGTYDCLAHRSEEKEETDNRTSQQKILNPSNLDAIIYGTSRKPKAWTSSRHWIIGLSSFLIGCLPLALLGGLTLFKHGQSSLAERAWTMTWMACGILIGILQHGFDTENSYERGERDAQLNVVMRYSQVLMGAPAIGGFVVVGKMLLHYGNCVKLY